MLDFNLADADYEKAHNWFVYNSCFSAFDAFIKEHKRMPRPWNFEDADVFTEMASTVSINIGKELDERWRYLVWLFSLLDQVISINC